jgi:glucose/mannose-6-phosphate isomerase
MSDLSRAAVEAVDPRRMVDDVLDQPAQLADALQRVGSTGLQERDLAGGLLVCGMGGSAIGGELASAAIGPRARRPIRTVRDYALEPWTSSASLVLCASYSGDTEEVLACFEAAGQVGAPRVALTTGGELAAAARAAGVPVIGVPAGFQPRAAVAYMTVAAIECAALCGAAPSLRGEVEAAADSLRPLAAEWGPDGPDDSEAKALARALWGAIPVVYGAGATEPPARRWKTQLNENAELAAFWAALPEADHNEICGWERARDLGPFSAVFLEESDQHPRTKARIELTAELIAAEGAPVERVEARGETRTERVLSLVLLGDLVSVYLAVLAGTDPTPVHAIERLKERLR